ncbi:hypothetical protein DZB84_20550 [Bacillus sp. HNG]|uniref:helix-turn-helix domain-containing protein n=1 Tax=Bacillus sp. HNG TaxID=2293325 RepID=UPI000E2FB421|nr:helix-turn-helix transcriptional regulator [Bacillus sp. HNG]RFB11460.1 hypothetical protein DZB84_20550 [Bacillus sp. HNG]
MKNSKMNFDEILNSKNFIKKPQLFTIDNLKDYINMTSQERKEIVSSFCSEEEINELMNKDYNLDSTMLIQFALEDFNMTIDQLSDKTRVKKETLKEIVTGKLLPWKLKVEEILQIIHTLNISIDEFVKGLKNKTIIVDPKDINISGIQLPRAKNMTKREQKRAMIDMEKQIIIQDEEREREKFIQTLNSFVNR